LQKQIDKLGLGRNPSPESNFQEALDFLPQASKARYFLLRNKSNESYYIRMKPMLKARGEQPKILNFNKIPDVLPMFLNDNNTILSCFPVKY
jgi:hypothetical protein